MNFFDDVRVVIDGDTTKINIGDFGQVEVPPLYASSVREAVGKKLILGIRPENFADIELLSEDQRNGSTMHAPVDVVEHLGSELLVYMTAGQKSVTARLDPRSTAHTGGQVTLHIDAANMHLFDSETGKAIV